MVHSVALSCTFWATSNLRKAPKCIPLLRDEINSPGSTARRAVLLQYHFGRGGGDGRSSFSLTAAIRLARGPSGSTTGLGSEAAAAATGVEAAGVTMSTSAPASRGRLGILSPVDWRMARSVCHPGDERSWNASARSCCVATRPKSASSSYKNHHVSKNEHNLQFH